MDKQIAINLRRILQAALDKHFTDGTVIKVGSCTFDDATVEFKVKVTPGGATALEKQARATWDGFAPEYGFTKSDFGRSFSHEDHTYTVIGWKSRGKRPVLTTRDDGKEGYQFPVSIALAQLQPKVFAKQQDEDKQQAEAARQAIERRDATGKPQLFVPYRRAKGPQWA